MNNYTKTFLPLTPVQRSEEELAERIDEKSYEIRVSVYVIGESVPN